MKDYYRIMGLAATASLADIKTAYRRQASSLHPDRNPSALAHTAFQELQEAYGVLADPDKRKAYDDNRRRSLIENPLDVAHQLWAAYLNNAVTHTK